MSMIDIRIRSVIASFIQMRDQREKMGTILQILLKQLILK